MVMTVDECCVYVLRTHRVHAPPWWPSRRRTPPPQTPAHTHVHQPTAHARWTRGGWHIVLAYISANKPCVTSPASLDMATARFACRQAACVRVEVVQLLHRVYRLTSNSSAPERFASSTAKSFPTTRRPAGPRPSPNCTSKRGLRYVCYQC